MSTEKIARLGALCSLEREEGQMAGVYAAQNAMSESRISEGNEVVIDAE